MIAALIIVGWLAAGWLGGRIIIIIAHECFGDPESAGVVLPALYTLIGPIGLIAATLVWVLEHDWPKGSVSKWHQNVWRVGK